MLRFIKLLRLRNSEFIQFFTDLVSFFQRHNIEELGIKEQLQPVVTEVEKIRVIHGENKGSEISEELKKLDDKRDDCVTGIHTAIEAYTLHYDKAIKEAAELLLKKMDIYGTSIAKQNYPTETVSISGIISSFTTEEKYKNALATLQLTDWAAQMNKDNTFFNQRYLDRVDELAKKTEDKIKALRKTTTENYYTLRDHLSAHATLEGESYKLIIDQINELIDKYNEIIIRRSGKGDEEK